MSDSESILRWYLVLTAASAAFFPLTSMLTTGLGSARIGLARPLGLVFLTMVVWWPAAIFGLPFTTTVLWIALALCGATLWLLWLRAKSVLPDWRAVAVFELLWLATFMAYAWFRSFFPDIVNTEKPMEIALLNSIVTSSSVPAPDPWLSGEAINYYYFGFQVFAAAIRLSGVDAAVGFNLALATIFASTACAVAAGASGIGNALSMSGRARVACAGLSTTMVLLAGNLETPRRLLRDARGTVEAGWWDGVGWQASRIIVDTNVHAVGDSRSTINEFPAFSLILGDLHPHVMTYPLLASILAVAIGFAASKHTGVPEVIIAGMLAGMLYVSNTWDAPLGLLLLAGGLSIAGYSHRRNLVIRIVLVGAGAVAAAGPFALQYTPPIAVENPDLPSWLVALPVVRSLANTFGVVYWKPTSVTDLMIVHGIWIGAFALFTGRIVYGNRQPGEWIVRHRHAMLVVSLLLLGLSVAWAPAILLIGIPLSLSVWIVATSRQSGLRILGGVFGIGFLLILVPEFVFLQDVFMDRMNTVFKFYFQAWLLLAVASSVVVIHTIQLLSKVLQAVAATVSGVAIVLSLTYTPLSAWDWTSGFASRSGLDGHAYLTRSAPDDYSAIQWIRSQARAGDWLIEAPGCSYLVIEGAPMSRVSSFSGVPSYIGWYGHEAQWRRGEGSQIYSTLNARVDGANAYLDGRITPTTMGPAFVIVGRQERFGAARCDRVYERADDAEARLRDTGWMVGFESDQVTVFVPPWLGNGAQSR